MTDLRASGLDPSHLHPDRLIGHVAGRQHGVILREQLKELGLERGAIANRRRRGLLRALYDGAYLWGQLTPTLDARALAAVAASGSGAFVTHLWALALYGLRACEDERVDITEGFEVDALWRRQRLVLEFDSYTFHATRAAFERDRRKTAALTRGRYVVLRTTWRELTGDSHALVARTAEALALSAGAGTES